MSWIIDASVATKWFLPEPDSSLADRILFSDRILIAPDCVVTEVASALVKNARARIVEPADVDDAIATMQSGIVRLRPTLPLLNRAATFSIRLSHAIYDCIYLALGEIERCPVLTADESLARKVAAAGMAGHVTLLADA